MTLSSTRHAALALLTLFAPACGSDLNQGSADLAAPADLSSAPDLGLPHYGWLGVIGNGQSLSVGAAGAPALSTVQPYHNLKLTDNGPAPKFPLSGTGQLALVPLVELIRSGITGYADSQYPANIAGETPHTSMANQISALSLAELHREQITVHSMVGWSGHPMSDINKQGMGRAYPGGLMEARAIKRLADQQGQRLAYGAVFLTHGESDSANPMYGAALYQMWQDYNQDLKAVTGQSEDVVLLASQQSTFPGDAMNRSLSTVAVWQQGVAHPGQVLCVGPKYQYPYAADGVHFTAAGYRRLGEKYAQVFHEVVVLRKPWQPLQPTAVSLSGTTLTVTFHVPVPPLAWEQTLSAPHQTAHTEWAKGRGFEVADSTGPLLINDAVLSGESVQLMLAKPPGAGLVVRYAMLQDGAGYLGGKANGRHGQLRDSDPFVGLDAQTLPCQAQAGSAQLQCTGTLDGRLVTDLVSGQGVAEGTVVQALDASGKVTLSGNYSGAPGTAMLTFRHDHRNYAVHFELPVL